MYFTTELIPKNKIAVVETYGPTGFTAGKYDAEGFISQPRWFPTREAAEAYASKLSTGAYSHH